MDFVESAYIFIVRLRYPGTPGKRLDRTVKYAHPQFGLCMRIKRLDFFSISMHRKRSPETLELPYMCLEVWATPITPELLAFPPAQKKKHTNRGIIHHFNSIVLQLRSKSATYSNSAKFWSRMTLICPTFFVGCGLFICSG